MFKKTTNFIKNIMSHDSFGLMVVNCSYYRPMTNKSSYSELRHLSNDRYFEICEQIRNK